MISKKVNINFSTFHEPFTNVNKAKNNPKRPYIPEHTYRILIIGDSGYRKTNTLLNRISCQLDMDNII